MGRESTGAMITNSCLRIELSYLIKQKVLVKGEVNGINLSWTSGSNITLIANFRGDNRYIQLNYTQTDRYGEKKQHSYKVYMSVVPSNLGKGEVLYFLCPVSNKKCRVLYMAYGCPIFKSREAYRHRIYYNSQIHSKYDYWNIRYWDAKKLYDKLLANAPKKKLHKGELTKYQQNLQRLEQKVYEYDEKRQQSFFGRISRWG